MRVAKTVRQEHTPDPSLVLAWSGVPEEDDSPFLDGISVTCRDCHQSITLEDGGEDLPKHVLCPTPHNPFGLTVCPGSGRAVPDTVTVTPPSARNHAHEPLTAAVLPEGLDWRLQPFSHVSGPTRPVRMPRMRQAA